MSHRDAKGNENVIPAKAGIQKTKELDSRLHGNDGLEVFSGENYLQPPLSPLGKGDFYVSTALKTA